MEKVIWGIIGCGDVAEKKSGPAFHSVPNSQLLAVMRRNAAKAKAFAEKHQVPKWYDKVEDLLENREINSVYIATPPNSHLELTLKAIEAGKNIYLEKPMALNKTEATKIVDALKRKSVKLTVAHYRRKLPAFLKVKELLNTNSIGQVSFVDIQILQPLKSNIIAQSGENWRTQPLISGGGYFHDLAPHQIDLLYYYFCDFENAAGFSVNQGGNYEAADIVNGIASFKNGIQFRGVWSFNVSADVKIDKCFIYGSKGIIEFSFFGDKVLLTVGSEQKVFPFTNPLYVQQPMIKETVNYFLGKSPNPCSAEEGLISMDIIDTFTSK